MSAAGYYLMLLTKDHGAGEIERRSIPGTTLFEYGERRTSTMPLRPEQSAKIAEIANRLLNSEWIKEYAEWHWKLRGQRRGKRHGGADGA